jgi:hypothetical protein
MTVMKRKKSSARFGDHQQTGNNEASQKLHFGDHQRARVLRRFASCEAKKKMQLYLTIIAWMLGNCLHECDDVDRKQNRHHPRPPAMFVDRAVEAPSPESLCGSRLWPFRRPLAPEQLLEVDPLPLRLREQSGARLSAKVPNDDTSLKRRMF